MEKLGLHGTLIKPFIKFRFITCFISIEQRSKGTKT